MVIRAPSGGPRVPEPQPGLRKDQPTSPLQRLVEFGAARTPQEARRVINELLASLRAAGFPVAKTGSPESQLKTALESFQKSEGLPADGQLDKGTLDRLLEGGHLPQKGDAGGVDSPAVVRGPGQDKSIAEVDKLKSFLGGGELGLPTGGDAPADSKSPKKTEVDEKAKASAQDKKPELDMKSFLSSLRGAGFSGHGKGADQLKDALKKVQSKDGLPQTGRIDERTAEALVKRGVLTEAQARDLVPTTSQAELKQPQDATFERARTANDQATQEATARGTPEPGEPNASVGRDGAQGSAVQAGEGGAGGAKAPGEGQGGVDGDAKEGELSAGNAPSGDDAVDDERRGHASIQDEAGGEEGYTEVPTLREQIDKGLLALVRDDGGRGAATYAWDFTLFRPGVYGRRQAAERLFHVVVTQASAFDPLWERARIAINAKLEQLEPDASIVGFEELAAALRRARVR